MKILLINPPQGKIIDSSLPKILIEKGDPMPPLGLMYLASYLQKNSHHQVEIAGCLVENLNHCDLEEKIIQAKPDVIGITAMTFTLLDVIQTIQTAKKIDPGIKIVIGGPHAHLYPKETLGLEGVDFVIKGEGEIPFFNLLKALEENSDLSSIDGLVFKKNGQIIDNPVGKLIQNLDELPFPARHLLPYKNYGSVLAKRFPVTTMFTSRGCPFKCIFCDRPHLGSAFRARSAKNVVDEMAECQKMGIKEIFIYDDTFAVNRQRVVDICSEIVGQNLDITWDVRTRVDTVDEELLKIMKQAGCQRIHFGVEAGTEKILKILRKGITLEQVRKAFQSAKKNGIETLAYFIIGSPQETKKDILETIKLAKKLNPDYAHFTIMTPYPGTDLYRLGLETKVLPCDYWQKFAENPNHNFSPPFWEEILTHEELIELIKKAYHSFYFSPAYILKRILRLKSWSEFKVKLKAGFDILKI